MNDIKDQWTSRVLKALEDMAKEAGVESDGFSKRLSVGKPPKSEMGDLSFPLFPFAKDFRKAPPVLASDLAERLGGEESGVGTAGPYLNIKINRAAAMKRLLVDVEAASDAWGSGNELSGRKVMIEFSSPNTNKPLHLGHLRNDILGESCARILQARGAEVQKVNLVNDRGVHICKSMLAYQKFGDGETPESLGMKSDRFVGDLYVKFAEWAKENDNAEKEAQEMLQAWESGDEEIRKLWELMNGWALTGIEATYRRTGVSFDHIYRESETYLLGKDQVLKGLDSGVFFKADDGSIRLDMTEIGLDTKVLLRSDGTSVYITQDLGTAISRHEQWPFDQLVYVVGSEQEYHFRVLFYALSKLGFTWAERLFHLSYGMVNLPEGKMKSREGTVVDADDLIDTLASLALTEIKEKGREGDVEDPKGTAEKIAIAALHYFLLQVSPGKDMIFNPEESLSFNGNTGPYLQYMVARISGLIAKASREVREAEPRPELLDRDDEWGLSRRIAEFPTLVSRAADKLDPSILASGLYEIARDFSRYYHEVPIAKADDAVLAASRMVLARAVLVTLKKGFRLLNIPYIESM
ncbi:MAG: arginine--tRNA ligase [Spirochaetaceae bacterium]|nr:arginine--tRNA ligase [Spirochaetaceae bacterium]